MFFQGIDVNRKIAKHTWYRRWRNLPSCLHNPIPVYCDSPFITFTYNFPNRHDAVVDSLSRGLASSHPQGVPRKAPSPILIRYFIRSASNRGARGFRPCRPAFVSCRAFSSGWIVSLEFRARACLLRGSSTLCKPAASSITRRRRDISRGSGREKAFSVRCRAGCQNATSALSFDCTR